MRILICDDDAAFGAKVAQYAAAYFEERAIPVQSTLCSSPREVLGLPELEQYQIAFLDVSMPELNGIALGGLLKQHNPEIRLVYVSAYLDFAIDGYKVSAYRYILKQDAARQLSGCLEDLYAEMTRHCRFSPCTATGKRCRSRWSRSIIWKAAGASCMCTVLCPA